MPLALRLLLVVAAIETLAWAVATPPLQGPDEAAHYSYAQYLAETGHKPQFAAGSGTVSNETGAAENSFNLYALPGRGEARPFWSRAELGSFKRYERALTGAERRDGGGPNALAKNPPLYYAYEAIPYRLTRDAGFRARLLTMRLFNGLLFLATVALTWLLAAELFRSVLLRTVATASVALLPMLAFMAGVVNSDSMLTAIWAAFLLLAVRLVLRGPTPRRVVGLLALCAAALLTHGRGLPLVPIALVALVLAYLRHRPPLGRAAAWVGGGLAVLAAAFVAYRLVLNSSGGGGVYGGEIHIDNFSFAQFGSYLWQFYLPKLSFMTPKIGPSYGFRQLFIERWLTGSFGGLDVTFSPGVYSAMQWLADLGLVALVVGLIARRRELRPRWDLLVLLGFTVVATVLFLHVASYRALLGGDDPLIVGRYLLPLTPVFGLAVAFVVGCLRERRQPYAASLIVAVGLLLQLGGLGLMVARFYG